MSRNKFVIDQNKPSKPEPVKLPIVKSVPVYVTCVCGKRSEYRVRMSRNNKRYDVYFCTSDTCDEEMWIEVDE